jgi:uncharacterized protein
MNLSLLSLAFTLGLLSTLHCWSMCGGLLLAFSPPARPRANAFSDLRRLLSYNLGRVTSYALAGAFGGGFGTLALQRISPGWGHQALEILAGLFLIASGLALLKRLPALAGFQRVGLLLWRRLQPLSHGLLPADRLHKRFLLGMIWGWLPCGFVYSMLALAAAQGTALAGALLMTIFGLGTLPGMLTGQSGLQAVRKRIAHWPAPALGAWLLISSGILLLYLQVPWRKSDLHASHVHQSSSRSISAAARSRSSNWPAPAAHQKAQPIATSSTIDTAIRR